MNGSREIPPREQWASTSFALNPEVSIETETRSLRGNQRVERLAYKLRARPPVQMGGLMASVLLAIRDQTTPFKGKRLIEQLRGAGVDPDHALAVIADLLEREIVFAPHTTEL